MGGFLRKFVPLWAHDLWHRFWPWFGDVFYGHPSEKLVVVGITGTNGKTTVAHLLSHVLSTAGLRVASVSSLRFQIAETERVNRLKMTMPGRMKLQRFLKDAVDAGCTHAVVEVTSEGIKQHRHEHIRFTGAVATNVTPEHIESHGSFLLYKTAKKKLFRIVAEEPDGFSVVNLDDESWKDFLERHPKRAFGYTIQRHHPKPRGVETIAAKPVKTKTGTVTLVFRKVRFSTKLFGAHNASNALAAVAAAKALGVANAAIKEALQSFTPPPGRMEVLQETPFKVVVDYAHTPDALEKVYETLYPSAKHLICVLGSAGGGRDRWKRPKMGEAASRYCSKMIVTNEDPYDEDPQQIIQEVAAGIKAEKILDRTVAIKRAISLAKKGDTVVITGKGAEPLMVVAGGKKIPWDDREKVREALAELRSGGRKRI